MKIKQGLSLSEHRKTGLRLKDTTSFITQLVCDLERAYRKSSRSVILSKRIEGLLWELRSDLEGQMSREHNSEDTSIYYGGTSGD